MHDEDQESLPLVAGDPEKAVGEDPITLAPTAKEDAEDRTRTDAAVAPETKPSLPLAGREVIAATGEGRRSELLASTATPLLASKEAVATALCFSPPAGGVIKENTLSAALQNLFGPCRTAPEVLFPALATISAAAASVWRCDEAEGGSIVLRVGLVKDGAGWPSGTSAVLQAAHECGARETEQWRAAMAARRVDQAVAAAREKLVLRAALDARTLGLPTAPIVSTCRSEDAAERLPSAFVLSDARPNKVMAALGGDRGVLVVQESTLPTIVGTRSNATGKAVAQLLNAAARGDRLLVPDQNGTMRVRSADAGVIGMVSFADALTLHRAAPEALRSTVFVPCNETGTGPMQPAFIEPLTVLLGRLRMFSDEPRVLVFQPGAARLLGRIKDKFDQLGPDLQHPFAAWREALPDLVVRLAAVLHVAENMLEGGEVPSELRPDTIERAATLVSHYVAAAGTRVLSPTSMSAQVTAARFVISWVQKHGSKRTAFDHRELVRGLQRSVGTTAAVDEGLELLSELGLVEMESKRPERWRPSTLLFTPQYRLPNLADDPRRS